MQTVQNDNSTVGGLSYSITGSGREIVLAIANVDGTASNHINGTPTIGDLLLNLPQASTVPGMEITIEAKTHSSTGVVLAGSHSGSVFGNWIYIVPFSGDIIDGSSVTLNTNGINTNASHNAITFFSDGASEWLVTSHK